MHEVTLHQHIIQAYLENLMTKKNGVELSANHKGNDGGVLSLNDCFLGLKLVIHSHLLPH